MQKIWSETVPEAKLWSETYFLTKRSETFEAKQSEMKRIFFPEFRKKEAKPFAFRLVSLWSETFLEAKLGHPSCRCCENGISLNLNRYCFQFAWYGTALAQTGPRTPPPQAGGLVRDTRHRDKNCVFLFAPVRTVVIGSGIFVFSWRRRWCF